MRCQAHRGERAGLDRRITRYRMAGMFPLKLVGRPALTRAAVPRSRLLLTWAKMPIAATTNAQIKPITTILRCVVRSAPYIE
jgi:hypothetical protein